MCAAQVLSQSEEPEADFLPVKVEYTKTSLFEAEVTPLHQNWHRLKLTQDCVRALRAYLAYFRPTLALAPEGSGEKGEEGEDEPVEQRPGSGQDRGVKFPISVALLRSVNSSQLALSQ